MTAAKVAKRVTVGVSGFLLDALHASTPVGKAESAYSRGDAFFQIDLQVDDDTSRVLSAIKAVGWMLDDVDYRSDHLITTTTDTDGTTREIYTSVRHGTYLFRRAD
ncbi:hypothetical protein KDN32_02320 [Nocardioides sp. J2M5]|uniref:hypothetical protein n=1 Tax=Nocardioides palaemonis TaxID=2829810 RepID=UPI001BAAF9D0|nr:hypothetical protein [Nocardioides palaemonis]MBS2936574.1 hypothetical protein [Nocardioides palaemonis]